MHGNDKGVIAWWGLLVVWASAWEVSVHLELLFNILSLEGWAYFSLLVQGGLEAFRAN